MIIILNLNRKVNKGNKDKVFEQTIAKDAKMKTLRAFCELLLKIAKLS